VVLLGEPVAVLLGGDDRDQDSALVEEGLGEQSVAAVREAGDSGEGSGLLGKSLT
jgi:hypothetical protein